MISKGTSTLLGLCLILVPLVTSQESYSSAGDRGDEEGTRNAKPELSRGYLGYQGTYEEAEDGRGRIRILEIFQKSPAQKAGLRKNDLIIAFNDLSFRFQNDLDMVRNLSWVSSGDLIELSVLRGDRTHIVGLTATEMPEGMAQALSEWIEAAETWYEGGGCEECLERKRRQRTLQAF